MQTWRCGGCIFLLFRCGFAGTFGWCSWSGVFITDSLDFLFVPVVQQRLGYTVPWVEMKIWASWKEQSWIVKRIPTRNVKSMNRMVDSYWFRGFFNKEKLGMNENAFAAILALSCVQVWPIEPVAMICLQIGIKEKRQNSFMLPNSSSCFIFSSQALCRDITAFHFPFVVAEKKAMIGLTSNLILSWSWSSCLRDMATWQLLKKLLGLSQGWILQMHGSCLNEPGWFWWKTVLFAREKTATALSKKHALKKRTSVHGNG